MITLDSKLVAVGPARTGIAPVHLLDVLDLSGNVYHWSDRKIIAPSGIVSVPSNPAYVAGAIIVPDHPATLMVSWEDGGGGSGGDYVVRVDFDGYGRAQMTYLGALHVVVFSDASGYAGQTLLGNTAGATAFITDGLTPGDELILELYSGNGETYYTGDASRNPDGLVHAWISWIDGTPVQYQPWLLSVPEFTFHRSSVTDSGTFVLQNLSGTTLARDMEQIIRAATLEGAMFVYRCWQTDAAAAWLEVHGKFTVPDGGVGPDTLTLQASSLSTSADVDAPLLEYSETCQWRWKSPQCAATGAAECGYSYQSCQQIDRVFVVLNSYEKNYGETSANIATKTINRLRRI
jgi:hypothetical protein